MKSITCSFALLLLVAGAYGQTTADSGFVIGDIGPHHRQWANVTKGTNQWGELVLSTNGAFMELATGLHYQRNGQWFVSKEEIRILPEGNAGALEGQVQVIFPSDIHEGVLEIIGPDGTHLRSRPLGISFFDSSTGNSVLIAELTNSTGRLLASGRQVLYPNAFSGVSADLVCTYRKSGLECDVVLRTQVPRPEEYSPGLNSTNVRLQVLTEWFDTPEPVQTPGPVFRNGLQDTALAFGSIQMARGKAFEIGTNPLTNAAARKPLAVCKSWVRLGGDRSFLIEEVPFLEIEPRLRALPAAMAAAGPTDSPDAIVGRVSPTRLLPPKRLARTGTKRIELAKADLSSVPGVVMDYTTVISGTTNMVFEDNVAYYVSGDCYLHGKTTFKSTVIKFGGSGQIHIDESGSIDCQGEPYRPTILTSVNDDSVGYPLCDYDEYWNPIYLGTGNPSMGDVNVFLDLACSTNVLRHMRFCYSYNAIFAWAGGCLDIWDCQFMNLDSAFTGDECDVGVHNVLLHLPESSSQAFFLYGGNMLAEQVTCDSAYTFLYLEDPETQVVTNRNCIYLSGILQYWVSEGELQYASQTNGIFERVGYGAHYLPTNSFHRNAGTTNISPALASLLKQKTTSAPICRTNNIVEDTFWGSDIERDTDTPDRGYHYEPIDYLVSCRVTNATLTLTGGVVVASFCSNNWQCGLSVTRASVHSQGTADRRNFLVHFSGVQEQNPSYNFWRYANPIHASYWASDLDFRFTTFVVPQGLELGLQLNATNLTVRDCEFYLGAGIGAGLSATNCTLWNNLFVYPALNLAAAQGAAYNNLFTGGGSGASASAVHLSYSGSGTNRDNAFDHCDVSMNGAFDYNAYLNGATHQCTLQSNDIVTNIVWQVGALGKYYQPGTSPLTGAGSVDASARGLYHYTTKTDLKREGTTRVDIGYHYVLTDREGNIQDSEYDGTPDYLEDTNGNGHYDSGESPWRLHIFLQPQSKSVHAGDTAVLILGAGVGPSCQWRFNGTNLTAQTNFVLTLDNVQTNQAGDYRAVISDGYCSMTSTVATVSVLVPPSVVLSSPTDGSTFSAPANITLNATAAASGANITNVQFYSGGVLLGAALTPSGGVYSVVWTNAPQGMHGLSAVGWDDNGLAMTSTVARVTVGNFGFRLGVNLNGPECVIEGNQWSGYEQALTIGLSVSSNARPALVTITSLLPSCDSGTSNMLQSLLRCDRLPPDFQQQTNPPWVSISSGVGTYPVTVSNIAAGYVITNKVYRGWKMVNNDGWSFTQGQLYPSPVYYSYGNTDGLNPFHYSPTHLNLANYIVNHRIDSWDISDVRWALCAVVNRTQIPEDPPLHYLMVSNACKYGAEFVPSSNQIALVMADLNHSGKAMGIEITNKAAGFTVLATIS